MHIRTTERYAYKLIRGIRQHDYVFGLAGEGKKDCVAWHLNTFACVPPLNSTLFIMGASTRHAIQISFRPPGGEREL